MARQDLGEGKRLEVARNSEDVGVMDCRGNVEVKCFCSSRLGALGRDWARWEEGRARQRRQRYARWVAALPVLAHPRVARKTTPRGCFVPRLRRVPSASSSWRSGLPAARGA